MDVKLKSKTHLLNTFFDYWLSLFARFASKFLKSDNMTLKKFWGKKSNNMSKNAEFYADFKSIKRDFKMHQKSYKQNKFDEHE